MTQNFAHRGFSARYPENTMLAFQKAIEAGCNGIELDVHLARDGEMVIIHDETVDRTTNGSGLVKDMDCAELRRLDAGKGERIPTIAEYFDLVEKTPVITNIELKNSLIWYDGMEEKLIDLIRSRGLSDRIIFSSFNHYSMLKCAKLAPEIRRGFLTSSWIIDAGAYAKKHGMTSLHPIYTCLSAETVAAIRHEGIAINTWTVNDPGDMRRLASLGVESIISNETELLRDILRSL